jgi:hypothetical protein
MTKAVLLLGALISIAACDVGVVPLTNTGGDGGPGSGSGIQPNVCVNRKATADITPAHTHSAPVVAGNPSNQGLQCISSGCHAAGGAGGEFSFAGTLYGSDGVTPDPGGAFVMIVGAGSSAVDANSPYTDAAGNFYLGPAEGDDITATYPVQVWATACPTITPMTQTVQQGQGDCFTCHSTPPTGGASGPLTL